jgi:flagellar hook-basal body complex protein FliE
MIDPISAVQGSDLAPTDEVELAQPRSEGPDFAQVFADQVESINQEVGSAENLLQRLASNQPVEIHDVMISLEKARISVLTLIQVRNRMVEAYQDIMRMQI